MRTVAQKMGIKEKTSAYFENAPKEALEDIRFPEIEISKILKGEFDYIHFFLQKHRQN